MSWSGRPGVLRAAVKPRGLLVWTALAIGAIAALSVGHAPKLIGTPVPSPVYQIEATSGNHQTLLTGTIPPVGVLAVPTPVDVNGDLLPDVTVAVNLVNLAGLGNGNLIAPNVEINRILPGVGISPSHLPLKIDAKITVINVGGSAPNLALRLGYDTGAGGAIPGKFKVTAAGLTSFFNPVVASVDAPGYLGPLSLVAGFEQGSQRTDASLRFSPLPTSLQFSYGSDAAGQHISASHAGAYGIGADKEVDLDANIAVNDSGQLSTIDAHVDRLPPTITTTILPGGADAGGFDYAATSTGRAPDVRIDVNGNKGGKPLVARVDIDALPSALHAEWNLPTNGPAHVRVTTPNASIAGIQARIANFTGAGSLPVYVPGSPQYLDVRETADKSQRLITGRIEGFSYADMTENAAGLDAEFRRVGQGTPLELHASLGSVGTAARRLDALTTVNPLPANVTASVQDQGADPIANPLKIVYTASDPITVTGHVEAREKTTAADAVCGTVGTLCGNLVVTNIPTRIETRITSLPGSTTTAAESRIAVDSTLRGGIKPNVTADVTLGLTDGTPLVAHAEANGIPQFLRVRAVSASGSGGTVDQFNACDINYTTSTCTQDPNGALDALVLGVRNFIDRPAGFPLEVPTAANDAELAARPNPANDALPFFEASARMTAIKEVKLVNQDGIGVRTRVGNGAALHAGIDVVGVHVGSDVVDLQGSSTVNQVPDLIELCYRGDEAFPTGTTDELLAPCVNKNPFNDAAPLAVAPLAVHYHASAPITTTGDLGFTKHGTPDRHVDAHLEATLPGDANAFVSSPKGKATRALVNTLPPGQTSGTGSLSVLFRAHVADGDLQCRDPRQPANGAEVECISGTMQSAPSTTTITYDPNAEQNNVDVQTSSSLSIPDFALSKVRGKLVGNTLTTDAMVLTGSVSQLPTHLWGSLHTPTDATGDTAVDFNASPPVGTVDVTMQNFVGADPLPADAPGQRAGLPAVDPLAHNYDTVTMEQRGDLLRVKAFIKDLTHAGYRNYVSGHDAQGPDPDVAPTAVRTGVVDVGFSTTRPMRVYVDSDDGNSRTLADVTLTDRPADMSLCFRKARATAQTVSEPTFCDTATGTKGAFALTSTDHDPSTHLDVHAFFRVTDAVNNDMLAGRVDVVDLPPMLQANLDGDGTVQVNALKPSPIHGLPPVAASVGQLGFHVATFDIDDADYPVAPYDAVTRGDPFPAPALGSQHLSAAITDKDLELRGELGPSSPGQPGSSLSSLSLSPHPCAGPSGVTGYPAYPAAVPGTSPFTCAQVAFQQHAGGGGSLGLALVVDKGGKRIKLHDAGLSALPSSFQVTMSDLDAVVGDNPSTPANEGTLLPPCGPAPTDATAPPPAGSCAPPMIRFDATTPAGTPALTGVIDIGRVDQLHYLDETVPSAADVPNMSAVPATFGLQALVVGKTLQHDTVVRAGINVALPNALSIDAFASWDDEEVVDGVDPTAPPAAHTKSSDLHFGYRAQVNGSDVDSLGTLTAVVVQGDGSQLIVTDGSEDPVGYSSGDGTTPAAVPTVGIPGRLGVTLYDRGDALTGRHMLQVDGNVSRATELRLRVAPESSGLAVDAHLLNLQPDAQQPPTQPSFRLRAEWIAKPEPVNPVETTGGSSSDDDDNKVVVTSLRATVDMAPANVDPSQFARLVDILARAADSPFGVQIQAFNKIDGDAVVNGVAGEPSALISVGASLDINPLNIFKHLGGGLRIELRSRLKANLLADRVSDITLRDDSIRVTMENRHHVNLPGTNQGAEGQAGIVPELNIDHLNVGWFVDLGFYVFQAFGIKWVPAFSDTFPALIDYEPCGSATEKGVNPYYGHYLMGDTLFAPLPSGSDDYDFITSANSEFVDADNLVHDFAVTISALEPRMLFFAAGIPIPFAANLIEALNEGIGLCHETSAPSTSMFNLVNGLPGDPVVNDIHPVLGAVQTVDAGDGPTIVTSGPLDVPATYTAANPLVLCGHRRYTSITIEGTLRVGTSEADGCLPGDVGELWLATDGAAGVPGDITIDGQVLLPDSAEHGLFIEAAHDLDINGSIVDRADGQLYLRASGTVLINGTVDADGASSELPRDNHNQLWGGGPDGNGGGGHITNGGTGSYPGSAGGHAYQDIERTQVASEVARGQYGGSDFGGRGGGVISIRADHLDIEGSVHASGTNGTSQDCAAAEADVPYGGGGGSGGGISLQTNDLTISAAEGVLYANGGNGGTSPAGGGGGGAAGIIKVIAVNYAGPDANDLLTAGGDGGNVGRPAPASGVVDNCYNHKLGAGATPTDNAALIDIGPQSTFVPYSQLWHTEDPNSQTNYDPRFRQHLLTGQFSANVPTEFADDYNVVICAGYLGPNAATKDTDGDGIPDGVPSRDDFRSKVPNAGASLHQPCGGPDRQIGSTWVHNARIVDGSPGSEGAGIGLDLGDAMHKAKCNDGDNARCPDGYWGVWTEVITTTVDDNNCFDSQDAGGANDDAVCQASETKPAVPDYVFGVDDTSPTVTSASVIATDGVVNLDHPGQEEWAVRGDSVSFTIDANDGGGGNTLSGTASIQCTEVSHWGRIPFACHRGANVHQFFRPIKYFQSFLLDGGGTPYLNDGQKDIEIDVIDAAGNHSRLPGGRWSPPNQLYIRRDVTPPVAQEASFSPSTPDGSNGWYKTPPQIVLIGDDDPLSTDLTTPGAGFPTDGHPPFVYRFDAGDEQPCVDPADPTATFCDVKGVPTNGTHTLSFTPVDAVGNRLEPGAMITSAPFKIDAVSPTSALLTAPGAPDPSANGWFRTSPQIVISGVDNPAGSGIAAMYYRVNGGLTNILYTGPFTFTQPGTYSLCWHAVDVAGNVEGEHCTGQPNQIPPIKIDGGVPTTTMKVLPAAPDGANGWYLSSPTVTVTDADNIGGSGVGAPMVSIDGADYAPYTGAITFAAQGAHEVRAFSVDGAGQRSSVVSAVVKLDTSTPTATVQMLPPAPARGIWWRRLPTFVLRGADAGGPGAGAGLDHLAYVLDNGPLTTYTVPVELTPGRHTLKYKAIDKAGRASLFADQAFTIPVDTAAPVAEPNTPTGLSIRIGGNNTVKLPFLVSDDWSSTVRVTVLVSDATNTLIRTLDAGTFAVTPGGAPVAGSVTWDGKDANGKSALLGIYQFRVVARDEAGNASESDGSRLIQVVLL